MQLIVSGHLLFGILALAADQILRRIAGDFYGEKRRAMELSRAPSSFGARK